MIDSAGKTGGFVFATNILFWAGLINGSNAAVFREN